MKIIYIGSGGVLSLVPFSYLLTNEHELLAVATDLQPQAQQSHPSFSIITEQTDSLAAQARVAGIPVLDLSASLPELLAAVRDLAPELILVSCVGKRLSQALLDLAKYGSFNLHPSALPQYRGPVPVFWQLRDGLCELAVSLHAMTQDMDAGDVLAQTRVPLTDGESRAQIDARLARAYCELLPGFLAGVSTGDLKPMPQNEANASYYGYPTADDFRIQRSWSARRMYNFVAATRDMGYVYPCEVDGLDLPIVDVIAFDEAQIPEENCVIDGDIILLACHPGLLRARLALV